jgi:hypothetical protein
MFNFPITIYFVSIDWIPAFMARCDACKDSIGTSDVTCLVAALNLLILRITISFGVPIGFEKLLFYVLLLQNLFCTMIE